MATIIILDGSCAVVIRSSYIGFTWVCVAGHKLNTSYVQYTHKQLPNCNHPHRTKWFSAPLTHIQPLHYPTYKLIQFISQLVNTNGCGYIRVLSEVTFFKAILPVVQRNCLMWPVDTLPVIHLKSK